jgi:hypothetical protein
MKSDTRHAAEFFAFLFLGTLVLPVLALGAGLEWSGKFLVRGANWILDLVD